jgi:hypothetical protein
VEGSMPIISAQRYFIYSALLHGLIVLFLLLLNKYTIPLAPRPQILSLEIIEPDPVEKIIHPKDEEKKLIVDQDKGICSIFEGRSKNLSRMDNIGIKAADSDDFIVDEAIARI